MRAKYDLVLAEDGHSALAACKRRTEPIDLAIIDIMMPGMNGFELLFELRELFPRVRPIFMSGFLPREALDKAGLAPEPGSFLVKPFSTRDLRDAIASQLERAQLRTATDSPGLR